MYYLFKTGKDAIIVLRISIIAPHQDVLGTKASLIYPVK